MFSGLFFLSKPLSLAAIRVRILILLTSSYHHIVLRALSISHVLLGLNLTSLYLAADVRAAELVSSNPSGADADVDQAIDNLLLMFTNQFAFAIPAFLHAFITEPLRSGL